jgi:hypothetical protein
MYPIVELFRGGFLLAVRLMPKQHATVMPASLAYALQCMRFDLAGVDPIGRAGGHIGRSKEPNKDGQVFRLSHLRFGFQRPLTAQ